MSDSSNKLSQFWEELKRRNVLRSLAIYAGSAFVFLEAATIIFPRWGFPDWTIDLVLYLLILGVFITFIVSWIFDITPQGVQKTKPLEEITETEKPADSKVWKAATYISLVIIVALIILNLVPLSKTIKTGDIQSLIILPFDNFTGDDSLDYFVAGMHASLINDVGRLGGLRVTCKTSSNVYKDVDMTASEIAKELNVDAVMETSVMCLGDTICVQYKLVDAKGEERQIYIADIKEEKSKILGLYNRITRQIANEIKIKVSPAEEQLLDKSRTVDKKAYDEYLKARVYFEDMHKESMIKALEYLNNAIEKEPDWAPLYAGLAQVWLGLQQMGYELPSVASPKIYEYLNKAIELDPDLPDSHYLSGLIAHVMEWDWEKSEKEFLKALAINPNDALSRIFYAQLLCVLQRNNEASEQGKLAMSLDPLNPMMKAWYGSLLLGIGDCMTPLSYGEEIVALDPESYMGNNLIEGAAYRCNEYGKVIQAVRYDLPFLIEDDAFNEIIRIYNENGLASAYKVIVERLEQFAENYSISFMDMSLRYIIADQPEKAMDWIEKGYEMHDPQMTYIATKMYHLDPLFTNSRFINIVEKMNLPLPKD